jgi:hypothetical protein
VHKNPYAVGFSITEEYHGVASALLKMIMAFI